MKRLLLTVTFGIVANAAAKTLPIDESLRIEIDSGWTYSERAAPSGSTFGHQVSVRHPNGVGVLHLQAYDAPVAVSDDALRRLTNVPLVESLVKGHWGDFPGYRHDYIEGGLFHRTWWLAKGPNVVLITYECDVDKRHVEIDQIEAIVQSLTLTSP